MTRRTIADLSPAHQAEVARQLTKGRPLGQARAQAVRQVECEPGKKRLRQRAGDGMNNTERAFLGWLKSQWPDAHIHREVSLPLANGVRYKVDFLCVHISDGRLRVVGWEVKGFMRDDAAVKLKVAASVYPWIVFWLAYKEGGEWRFQGVTA